MGFKNQLVATVATAVCATAIFCTGCDSGRAANEVASAPDVETMGVVCTAWIHQAIVRELGGENFSSRQIAPAKGLNGSNRNDFFPSDADLVRVQQARLFIDNGFQAPYVNWPQMITLDESRVCIASRKIKLDEYVLPIKEHHIAHSHGPEGEHSHSYQVPYVWLDSQLLSKQLEVIAEQLQKLKPELQKSIGERKSVFVERLAGQTSLVQRLGESLNDRVAVHLANPDLLYLTKAMGIEAKYELWFDDPGTEAVSARTQELLSALPPDKHLLLLWPGALPASVSGLHFDSLVIIEIDMLENDTGNSAEGFMDRLENNLNRIRATLHAEGVDSGGQEDAANSRNPGDQSG